MTANVSNDPECDGSGTIRMFFNNEQVSSPYTATWCRPVFLEAHKDGCSHFSHWTKNGRVYSQNEVLSVIETITLEACFKRSTSELEFETAGGSTEQDICLGDSINRVKLTTSDGSLSYTVTGDDSGLTANVENGYSSLPDCSNYGITIMPNQGSSKNLAYYCYPELMRDEYGFRRITNYSVEIFLTPGVESSLIGAIYNQTHGCDQNLV